MHRHPLCPRAKAASSGFTEGVFTEEVATIQRLESMGEFYNYPGQAGCVATKTPQDSEKGERAEGKLWNSSAGPALAVFSAGTHALADYAAFYGVNASHDSTRAGDCDRTIRSTSSRRNSSGGRQGQETTRTACYCQISETSLRQAGEEAQDSQSCHGGKKEIAHLLDQLHRRVHLTLEAVCRRFHNQRPRFGEEGEQAREAVQDARNKYDAAKEANDKQDAVALEEVEEISDAMDEDQMDKIASAEDIKAGIQSALDGLGNFRVTPLEAHPEAAALKKQKTGDGEEDPRGPGSSALKPFHQPGK